MSESNSSSAAPETTQAADSKTILADAPEAKATGESKSDVNPGNTTQADPKAGEAGAPTEYKLTLPEGSTLDPKALEEAVSFAKEHKLSNEQAQKILDRESAAVKSVFDKQQADIKVMTDSWLNEAMNDPDMGGEKFKENAEHAKRAIQRFGSEKLKEALNSNGLGNHPELIRAFSKIGKHFADDSAPSSRAITSEGLSAAEVMFPKSK